jgi:hypothetical protein
LQEGKLKDKEQDLRICELKIREIRRIQANAMSLNNANANAGGGGAADEKKQGGGPSQSPQVKR